MSPDTSAADSKDTLDLDNAEWLPPRNQRSYVAMITVQALNAFNDNFVKVLLIAFAGAVASGTKLGNEMAANLGIIFAVPYIIFAPVTGWLSDRFSKQRVILWMQVIQVVIFGLFLGALMIHETEPTLWASLACFLLLATQAAFFSPAKYGIAKELVGSRRIGSASGVLQLTNFVGILGGMGLAGFWFAGRLKSLGDPWAAVWLPMVVVSIVAVAQIFGSLLIQRTEAHDEVKFHRGVWWEHFAHLKLLFSQRPLKLAALGVTYFWFMSNAVATILVTLANELHPTDKAAATQELSIMPAMLGVGVMIGSVIAGWVCRRRIELGLVPLSGYILAGSLLWSGFAPISPWIYMALICIGMAGGAFMTPLYAFVQDRSRPEERARIMSAMNLMDCVAGLLANVAVKLLVRNDVPAGTQLLLIVPITLVAAIFITRLLPRPLMMLIVNSIVRLIYRIDMRHADRMPKSGALLVLPNHLSYADALLLGVSTPRMVRFVMLDSLYKIKFIQWFFKLFGTVPISATKAKEAVRTVSEALQEGEAAVIFPEGQLTRTGFLNEVHKGYHLMARGTENPVMVQPVWLDGLWGSIFSFEGGRFFRKVPRAFPYRLSVWFGDPMDAEFATPERVREAMLALSAEAFLSRATTLHTPKLSAPDRHMLAHDHAAVAHVNALRVLETSLLRQGDLVVCLFSPDHSIGHTFGIALPHLRGITAVWSLEELQAALAKTRSEERRIILIGDAALLADDRLKARTEEHPHTIAIQLLSKGSLASAPPALPPDALPALFDEASGVLLTLSVPDPELPKKEQGRQFGHRAGSLGHILPGLAVQSHTGGLRLSRLLPHSEATVELPFVKLDVEGFVVPMTAPTPAMVANSPMETSLNPTAPSA